MSNHNHKKENRGSKRQQKREVKQQHKSERRQPQREKLIKTVVLQSRPRINNKTERRMDRISPSGTVLSSNRGPQRLQNRTGNIASGSGVNKYVECLMDPKRNMCRIPDGNPRQTAVVRSINEYNLVVSTDAQTQGAFSFCCRPVLGDTSSPVSYQTGVADVLKIAAGTTPWDEIDWSDPTNYVSDTSLGSDPRLDTNSATLTAAQPVSFGGNVSANLTPTNAFVGTTTFLTTNLGTPLVRKTVKGLGGLAPADLGIMVLPYGDWVITIAEKISFTATPSGNYVVMKAYDNTNLLNAVRTIGSQNPQTSVTSTGTTYNVGATFNVQSMPGANLFGVILVGGDDNTVGNSTISSSFYQANSSSFAGTVSNDTGPASEIRPVAMSVFLSFVGSSLNDGGQISSAFVPSELVTDNYYSQGLSGGGQLQLEASVRKLDRAYNGALRDGTYCVWTPYDPKDISFNPPSLANAAKLPAIVVSGYFTPDGSNNTASGIYRNLRLEICVCYEFVTKNTDRELVNYPGSQQILDMSWSLMKSEVQCRANGEHMMWLKAMYAKIKKFAVENQHILIPLAKATLMATGL